MEIDDQAKEIVRDIGTAINESVENSTKVAEAIERLRDAGYEMELTLRLEIGLRPHSEGGDADDGGLNLTEEDVQILQRMKIRSIRKRAKSPDSSPRFQVPSSRPNSPDFEIQLLLVPSVTENKSTCFVLFHGSCVCLFHQKRDPGNNTKGAE